MINVCDTYLYRMNFLIMLAASLLRMSRIIRQYGICIIVFFKAFEKNIALK